MQHLPRLLFALYIIVGALSPLQAEPVSLFDGHSFEGWEGPLQSFRIEEGAIIGGNLIKRIPKNQFISTTKRFKDFELRVTFKILGENANAGIQFRTERIPDHHEVIGYQADIGGKGGRYWGALYDESRRRKILAEPNLVELSPLIKFDGWNDYIIRAEGNRIRLWLNGTLTVDYLEDDPDIAHEGVIALQIHSGGPSEAWYKNITIEEL